MAKRPRTPALRPTRPLRPTMAHLRNLGPQSRRWLEACGVEGLDDLEALGAVEVYRRVRAAGHPATLNLLWGLEAALRNVDWRTLPEEVKARLRAEVAGA